MTHPHIRVERRRKACLWAFSLAMLGWLIFVMMTFKEGDGASSLVTVISVWIVGVICLGLYVAYGPLPDVRRAAPRQAPPPLRES